MYPNKETREEKWKKIRGKAKDLSNPTRAIIEAFPIQTDRFSRLFGRTSATLHQEVWPHGMRRLEDVFSGERANVLPILMGEEIAETFLRVWNRLDRYPYQTDSWRRSFRSRMDHWLYRTRGVNLLIAATWLGLSGFSLKEWLESRAKRGENHDQRSYEYILIPDMIALEIDSGNAELLARLGDIVTDEAGQGELSREIIKGLLASADPAAHALVAGLLRAARLQEGLRQAILETMDEGSIEGFMAMMDVIIDDNLLRFSSVVRGFQTWTGLGVETERPPVIRKCFEAARRCLADAAYREECLAGHDSQLATIALWALAFTDLGDAREKIAAILADGPRHQRLTALCFLSETSAPRFQYDLVRDYLEDADTEVRGWACHNLSFNTYVNEEEMLSPDAKEAAMLFAALDRNVEGFSKKELVFENSMFPNRTLKFSRDSLLSHMVDLVSLYPDTERTDRLCALSGKMESGTRRSLIDKCLKVPQTALQKETLVAALGDKGSWVREAARKRVEKLDLTAEDYIRLEGFLQYKAGDLRKNVLRLLRKQSPEAMAESLERLRGDKDERKRAGGEELLSLLKDDPAYAAIYEKAAPAEAKKETVTYGPDNGFGLFDPQKRLPMPEFAPDSGFVIGNVIRGDQEQLQKVLQGLNDLVDVHREYQYTAYYQWGATEKVVLGSEQYLRTARPPEEWRDDGARLDHYPLPEVWREFVATQGVTTELLTELSYCLRYTKGSSIWGLDLSKTLFPMKTCRLVDEFCTRLPHGQIVRELVSLLWWDIPREVSWPLVRNVVLTILEAAYACDDAMNAKEWPNSLASWFHIFEKCSGGDETRSDEAFLIAYSCCQKRKYPEELGLSLGGIVRALDKGVIDDNAFMRVILGSENAPHHLSVLTNLHHYQYKENKLGSYTRWKTLMPKIVERLLEVEIARGDLPTPASKLAARIGRYDGVHHFVGILAATGKDPFERGYLSGYYQQDGGTKKSMLSLLLKNCWPGRDDTAEALAALLKKTKLAEARLLEGAMYAPQWIGVVAAYLGWNGLESACWYFHAHANESFSDEKTAAIARYSPIDPKDFQDGAFDAAWFREAYDTLGAERFAKVYGYAKYISGGANHRRAQMFADATLGKLDRDTLETELFAKRNKDKVLAYSLVPLSDRKDLLHRYEMLQKFLKESKQFGALRRESEARVTALAIGNLARTAGYADTDRFVWSMEGEKTKEIEAFLTPQQIGDVEIRLEIDASGAAKVKVAKAGKELKDVPAALKKNETVLEMKALQKALKDQSSRARVALERAMERESIFTGAEIVSFSANPVLKPLIESLVFKAGDAFGFHDDPAVRKAKSVLIAHPVHLHAAGRWAEFQKHLFEHSIVQPFKQVFRELYLPTADELESKTISHRYAGHQVQPQKTLALLKGRGWTASYEDGLQKVYHAENLIARIYAAADWFSPADIEAPTLETVDFTQRKTYDSVAFSAISPVLFSEVMRDVDLVVSVAHAGGVDPEASHSTVEMRATIVEETLRLMKIDNVRLKAPHVFITGKLGEYTVHLGSAQAHKMAGGALFILAVPSQHRGRLFLPFIDEDPRTAEVLTKILFLAEDSKIKDPSILDQLRG